MLDPRLCVSFLSIVTAAVLVGSCSGTSSNAPAGGCATSCETRGWGRIIVGAISVGDAGALPPLTAHAEFSDGFSTALDALQCQALPPPYVCSFNAFGNPKETWVRVTVNTPDHSVTQTVNLMKFNLCGRDIAYLPMFVDAGSEPMFGEVSYISPCRILN